MLDVVPFLGAIPAFGGWAAYAAALLALWLLLGLGRRAIDWRSERRRLAALEEGASEPVSLHPLIDPRLCIGCGACTHACPEGKIIGLIGGKASLLDPSACIGHGACKTACPTGAIELVLGSARRGVDIPVLKPDFGTSVPGLYVAGELGGMGLIANAIEQGRQAMDAISRLDGLGRPELLDCIIVGSGPAGLAAALAAKEKGLSFVVLEQAALGGTVANYPRAKLVMTRPAELPLYGRLKLTRVRKERLLSLWQSIASSAKLPIIAGARVERIAARPWGHDVVTATDRYSARAVLLATGRRGAPRRLGVPGEELPKVTYALAEPGQYRRQRVLVVGGGGSALEAALALAEVRGCAVTLCHRGTAFGRARPELRRRFEALEEKGFVSVLRETTVTAIAEGRVEVDQRGRRYALANDAVIICAGGLLPTALLASAGVAIETRRGEPTVVA